MTNESICILPWISINTNPHGTVRACGRSSPVDKTSSLKNTDINTAWNSDYFKNLRLDMLKGIKNSNCKNCHLQESLGGKSKRQDVNREFEIDEKYLKEITQSNGAIAENPKYIDLRIGNVCNLKCVHCFTGNSSKWYEDKLLLDKYENTPNLKFNNDWISEKGNVWSWIKNNIDDIICINVLGGEPFVHKDHLKFLDWCITNKKTHLHLKYITNGISLTPQYLKKLKKFRKVDLGISLDAVGKTAEFLRFPTRWHSLYSILQTVNKQLDSAYFNWTCYNLNILRLPETYEFCRDHFPNIEFRFSDYVTAPAHLSVQNLPYHFKYEIVNKVKIVPNSVFYLNFMMQESLWENNKQVLLNYLEDLDKQRKTNWRNVLPEIKELF